MNCECGKPLNPRRPRKTMLCRACAARQSARDPALRARRSKTLQGWAERNRETIVERAARARKAKEEKPDYLARQSASGRRAQRSFVEKRLAWCPMEYRALYRSLRRKAGVGAKGAKAAVLQQIEIDRARYLRTGHLQTKGNDR